MVKREITFGKCECENDTFKIRVTPYGELGSNTEWFCIKCGKSPGGIFNDPLKEIPPEIYEIRGDVEDEKEETSFNDKLAEVAIQDEMSIGDPSLTRKSIWLKPKTQMYYDLAKQGTFTNYAESDEISVLNEFDGNLSDFFNAIIDDYFARIFNADIGILARRYVNRP